MSRTLARILYVEDEPDIRMVAQMALEAVGGFTVIACPSGSEALAAAPTAEADLLVLDVMMPGMDGPSTLKALRALPRERGVGTVSHCVPQGVDVRHFFRQGAPVVGALLIEKLLKLLRRCVRAFSFFEAAPTAAAPGAGCAPCRQSAWRRRGEC